MRLGGNRHYLFHPVLPRSRPRLRRFVSQIAGRSLCCHCFDRVGRFARRSLTGVARVSCSQRVTFMTMQHVSRARRVLNIAHTVSSPSGVSTRFTILIHSSLGKLNLNQHLVRGLVACAQSRKLRHLGNVAVPGGHNVITLTHGLKFGISVRLRRKVIKLALGLTRHRRS